MSAPMHPAAPLVATCSPGWRAAGSGAVPVLPQVPTQDNHCDCGLFVCSYIEYFTHRLPKGAALAPGCRRPPAVFAFACHRLQPPCLTMRLCHALSCVYLCRRHSGSSPRAAAICWPDIDTLKGYAKTNRDLFDGTPDCVPGGWVAGWLGGRELSWGSFTHHQKQWRSPDPSRAGQDKVLAPDHVRVFQAVELLPPVQAC